MTVYIVTEKYYSDKYNVAVLTNEEEAKRIAENYESAIIEPHELDCADFVADDKRFVYCSVIHTVCFHDLMETKLYDAKWQEEVRRVYPYFDEENIKYGEVIGGMLIFVKAFNEKEAIEVASRIYKTWKTYSRINR